MRTNGLFLGKMLILAFVLESLMSAWMPSGFIGRVLGGESLLPIVTATLIGIPAYLNGTAALPLMRELMHQGMAPGAAMAFLIGGGVTSIPAAIAVWSIARPTVFAAYLAFAALGAVLSGLAWQAVPTIAVRRRTKLCASSFCLECFCSICAAPAPVPSIADLPCVGNRGNAVSMKMPGGRRSYQCAMNVGG